MTNVVRYKPTSRCTTVVPITYAEGTTGPSPVVLKTHVGDKGSTAWDAMKQLWDRPETWRDTVLLAEPLAFDEEEKILVQGPIPEAMTLKELARNAIREGDPQMLDTLRDELAKTGRALAAIHASGAVYQRTITFEDELAEVQDIIDRLALTVPSLKGAGTELLEQLTAASRQVPAGDQVPAHHDFRPAQVLLHDGEIGFIDFDGASMAEPALDLGRFRAKLRDIGISTLTFKGEMLSGEPLEKNLALLDDLCDTFLAAYQEHGQVSTQRVAAVGGVRPDDRDAARLDEGAPDAPRPALGDPQASAGPARRLSDNSRDQFCPTRSWPKLWCGSEATSSKPGRLVDASRVDEHVVGPQGDAVVGDDSSDERLEVRIPVELAGVQLAVGHHHPPEVAGAVQWPDDRLVVTRQRGSFRRNPHALTATLAP